MTPVESLLLLLVACLCGSIGQALAGYTPGGCFVALALGFVGAFLGTWLARTLSLPELFELQIGDTRFPIVWSILGSAIFAAMLALLSLGRRDIE